MDSLPHCISVAICGGGVELSAGQEDSPCVPHDMYPGLYNSFTSESCGDGLILPPYYAFTLYNLVLLTYDSGQARRVAWSFSPSSWNTRRQAACLLPRADGPLLSSGISTQIEVSHQSS
jgi:hypothetical protein